MHPVTSQIHRYGSKAHRHQQGERWGDSLASLLPVRQEERMMTPESLLCYKQHITDTVHTWKNFFFSERSDFEVFRDCF